MGALLTVSCFALGCGSRPPPDPLDEPTLRTPQVSPLTVGCPVGAQVYPLGEKYPSDDGCNTCTCTEDGPMCTKMACTAPDTHHFALRFARGSAVPDGSGVAVMGSIARALRENPSDQVVVRGHATAVERQADRTLALRRAEAAAARLRALGVQTDQLVAEDAGEAGEPLVLFQRVRR